LPDLPVVGLFLRSIDQFGVRGTSTACPLSCILWYGYHTTPISCEEPTSSIYEHSRIYM
jgi:hypothetical protein